MFGHEQSMEYHETSVWKGVENNQNQLRYWEILGAQCLSRGCMVSPKAAVRATCWQEVSSRPLSSLPPGRVQATYAERTRYVLKLKSRYQDPSIHQYFLP